MRGNRAWEDDDMGQLVVTRGADTSGAALRSRLRFACTTSSSPSQPPLSFRAWASLSCWAAPARNTLPSKTTE